MTDLSATPSDFSHILRLQPEDVAGIGGNASGQVRSVSRT
jgi:hypothetical protein